MNTYEIIDDCRRNLTKYTIKAFSCIPKIDEPLILDMGCGTGVSILALIEICNGNFYAIDSDNSCLLQLKEKMNVLNYTDRIKVIQASVFDENQPHNKFDIVLAEGLLNITGFEKGLSFLINYLKPNGHLIIHDELSNDTEKKIIFEKHDLELLNSFVLDENVWWDDYFGCLEKAINKDNAIFFEKEISEIIGFKKSPEKFQSIFYILQKRKCDYG